VIYVLDASALIALIKNEPGAGVVDAILGDDANTCWVHAVNLCEAYYDFVRASDVRRAEELVAGLMDTGIIVREDMDGSFWRKVGLHKALLKRISLADCFCIALADRLNAEIITADRHELEAVRDQGLCRITFIR
jgi:PIN domain nuclease of toxin-antitoxin system